MNEWTRARRNEWEWSCGCEAETIIKHVCLLYATHRTGAHQCARNVYVCIQICTSVNKGDEEQRERERMNVQLRTNSNEIRFVLYMCSRLLHYYHRI